MTTLSSAELEVQTYGREKARTGLFSDGSGLQCDGKGNVVFIEPCKPLATFLLTKRQGCVVADDTPIGCFATLGEALSHARELIRYVDGPGIYVYKIWDLANPRRKTSEIRSAKAYDPKVHSEFFSTFTLD